MCCLSHHPPLLHIALRCLVSWDIVSCSAVAVCQERQNICSSITHTHSNRHPEIRREHLHTYAVNTETPADNECSHCVWVHFISRTYYRYRKKLCISTVCKTHSIKFGVLWFLRNSHKHGSRWIDYPKWSLGVSECVNLCVHDALQ